MEWSVVANFYGKIFMHEGVTCWEMRIWSSKKWRYCDHEHKVKVLFSITCKVMIKSGIATTVESIVVKHGTVHVSLNSFIVITFLMTFAWR